MKKHIVGLALMLMTSVSYAKSFECTGYASGSAVGPAIQVNAAKAAVAETKAKARLKKEGKKVDYVTCE